MVKMYSLSTCPWCKKMKRLLDDEGIAYDVVDLDIAEDDEKQQAFAEMAEHGLSPAFPITIVDGDVIQGYHPDRVKAALEAADE